LGGQWGTYLDSYRINAALLGFVGQAAYPGETLLTWRMTEAPYVRYAAGMYHDTWNGLPSHSPHLTAPDLQQLRLRRPAELLLLNDTAAPFPTALRQLHGFRPKLMRAAELRSGSLVLHVWLLRLGVYAQPPSGG
jgi:hypothetical protein